MGNRILLKAEKKHSDLLSQKFPAFPASQPAEAAQSARRVRNCRCAPRAVALPSAPKAKPGGHLGVARGCASIRSKAPAPSFGSRLRGVSLSLASPRALSSQASPQDPHF